MALLAALLLAGGAAPSTATPEAAIIAARAAAERGELATGLRGLEAALARAPSPPDAAALRLEAARLAIALGERDRANAHATALERLLPAFAQAQAVLPRLQREAARLREQLGDPRKAEPLLTAVAQGLAALAPNAAAEAANALGMAQVELLRPGEAAATFRRALARPGGETWRATLLLNLGGALLEADDLDGARAALAEADGATQDAAARDGAVLLRAQLLLRDARLREGETLLEQAGALASNEASRGHALFLLATARFNRGRMPEALRTGLAAAAAYQNSLGPWHPALGRTLHLLGTASGELRDRAGAAAFFARATEIARGAFGPRSSQVLATEIEWAGIELLDGNPRAAERRLIGLTQPTATTGAEARLAGLAQVVHGLVAETRNASAEAVERFRAAQRLIGRAGAVGEVDLSFSEVRLGRLLTRMGRLNEAGPPIERALARHERLGTAGTARQADALMARAELRAAQGNRRGALEDGQTAYAGLRQRLEAGEPPDEGGAFRRGAREVLAAHARLLVQLGPHDPALLEQAFEATQAALASRAGEALRLTAMRRSAGPAVEALLRVRDDTMEELRQLAALERAALQREGPESTRETARLRTVQGERTKALAALDQRLAALPGGASAGRAMAGLQAVRTALEPGTAAVVTLATGDGLLVWTLAREGVSATLVPVTEAGLAALVRRVRAGVDPRSADSVPFDWDAARQLHRTVIGPAGPLVARKRQLVMVTDGALQSIPAALLVGQDADDWLVRRFALSVAPSVDALVVARTGQASTATHAFLGVGDPQLPTDDRPVQVASRGMPPDLRKVLAGMQPLPETRTELGQIASLFPDGEARLILGHDATKETLAAAAPERYRYVAFATHAVMAGELPGVTEPAIILSTLGPDLAGGLLTASDIAGMTLDAELVLLSACNTAAPDGGPFAEGLSGLARAFLHAGTRSLLVSHWAVDSLGTVELTTRFMAALRTDPAHHKASALQAAVVSLLDSPDPRLRHPTVWAPFVLVGE